MTTLKQIASMLDNAPRMGRNIDDPEGTCYIIMSHTLAKEISETLKDKSYEFEAVLDEHRNKIKQLKDELGALGVTYIPVITMNHLHSEKKRD